MTTLLDADTLSTIFTVLFLMGMAGLALWAGQRGPAETMTESMKEER